jgi:hypothetical protein
MRVQLQFTDETILPIHEGLCTSPALDREATLGGQAVENVETITSFVYGDPEAYEALLVADESVLDYTITPAEDGCFVYCRRELGPRGTSLVHAFARETIVLVPPLEFRSDRTAHMTIAGHPDDLRTILDRLPEGIESEVRCVGTGLTAYESMMTDRQREALRIAFELGYYEIPRRNGIEAVADALGCVVSTASELLRRAEAHAVKQALGASRSGDHDLGG